MAKTDSTQYGSQPAGMQDDEPKYNWSYWNQQMTDSGTMFTKPVKRGEQALARYNDDKSEDASYQNSNKLNLYHADVDMLMSMLYGNIPKVQAKRRFSDPSDDVGRVAGDIMTRLLNNDLADNGYEFSEVIRANIQDWLIPGPGIARVMYEAQFETEEVTGMDSEGNMVSVETEKLVWQDAPIKYIHWRDVRWGWCRKYSDMPWLAYRSYMTKKEARNRFGDEVANQLTYANQTKNSRDSENHNPEEDNKEPKAQVWEIWCKITRTVYWWSEDHQVILDKKDDPLNLSSFYPSPPFLMANNTTSLYMYTTDYYYAQDLYCEIDRLQERIHMITKAIRAAGVYAKDEQDAIGRLMKETSENDLIPVDNWAIFAEKGGLRGVIEWIPVEELSRVLAELTTQQQLSIAKLHQVTGMSDVMRGTATNQGAVSATERAIQSRFGSIRIQARQDEVERYATDLLQIKAEVIARFFTPETILARSNILRTNNAKYAEQAVELIKDPEQAKIRVSVQSESMAMADYAVLKQERTEFIQQMGFFIQSAQGLPKEMIPGALKMLQWGLAGFKGSSEIESVVDDMVTTFEEQLKNPPPPQPNPEQIKHQNKMQEEQFKHQAKMRETAMDHQQEMQKLMAEFQLAIKELAARSGSDIEFERLQAAFNMMEKEMENSQKLNQMYTQGNIQLAVSNDNGG